MFWRSGGREALEIPVVEKKVELVISGVNLKGVY